MNDLIQIQLVGGGMDGVEVQIDMGYCCNELEFPRLPNSRFSDKTNLDYDVYVRLGDADIFVWKGMREG